MYHFREIRDLAPVVVWCIVQDCDLMYFLMTNDVESFSIPLNRLDPDTAREVYEVGLPRLLDVYAKTDIRCTFHFTGKMVENGS